MNTKLLDALDTMAEFGAMWARRREAGQPIDALALAIIKQAMDIMDALPEEDAAKAAEEYLAEIRSGSQGSADSVRDSPLYRGPSSGTLFGNE